VRTTIRRSCCSPLVTGDDGLEPLTEWRDCLRTAGYTAEALEAAFALPKDVAALKALLGLDGEHNRIAWLGFVGAVRMRLHIAAPEPDVAPPPLVRTRLHAAEQRERRELCGRARGPQPNHRMPG